MDGVCPACGEWVEFENGTRWEDVPDGCEPFELWTCPWCGSSRSDQSIRKATKEREERLTVPAGC